MPIGALHPWNQVHESRHEEAAAHLLLLRFCCRWRWKEAGLWITLSGSASLSSASDVSTPALTKDPCDSGQQGIIFEGAFGAGAAQSLKSCEWSADRTAVG